MSPKRAAGHSRDTGEAGNVEGLKAQRTIVRSEDLELRRVLKREPQQRLGSAALVLHSAPLAKMPLAISSVSQRAHAVAA